MTGKPIDYSKLKETKVTLPLIALVGIAIFAWKFDGLTVDYLDEFFISVTHAEDAHTEIAESFKVITTQMTKTQTVVVTHIHEYKLNENAKETRQISNELYNLELYVAANTQSDLTRNRKRDLQNQLETLGRVRACLIQNLQLPEDQQQNCDAII